MWSVVIPPAATARPLKGTFQASFSQRARSNASVSCVSTLLPFHKASASCTAAESSP